MMPESKQKPANGSDRAPYSKKEVRGPILLTLLIYAAVSASYCVFHDRLGLPNPRFNTVTDRVLYAISLLVFSAAPLMFAITHVMFGRITNRMLRNPLSGNEHLAEKANRILSNTVEQFLLHTVNVLVFAVVAPSNYNFIIRYLVASFVVGRLLFTIGYMRHVKHRAYGFAITFVPTQMLFGYNLLRVCQLV